MEKPVAEEDAPNDVETGREGGLHQPMLQSQKRRFSWANIQREDKGEDIIDGSNLNGSVRYPTIIHGPRVFDNPLNEWYLY
ncbi:hypothetical protein PNQ29_03475 [Halobacterium salinarum]|uniref:hypothetical protein n=1 Tax=Halobacterium salinarum TaxID=2242 RepID=UPI0025542373|nr:hypothetical protein [Halobacterium salinarum]MDL0118804.1 hypothetical protein [Halobacterium salinarum]